MRVDLRYDHSEGLAVDILNGLARHNAQLFRRRKLPLLYQSGVVYRREQGEVWSDVVHTYRQGWEDCDALSAVRAGELRALGVGALAEGEPGFAEAKRRNLRALDAEVFLETYTQPGDRGGLYHCLTRYRLVAPDSPRSSRDAWFVDDPSLRLGMRDGMVDKKILAFWQARGITPGTPLEV